MKFFKKIFENNKEFKTVFTVAILIIFIFSGIIFSGISLLNLQKISEMFDLAFTQTSEKIHSEFKNNIDKVQIIARNPISQNEDKEISGKYIEQFLSGQEKIEGIYLFKGNPAYFDEENLNTAADSVKKYSYISFIKKGIKIYKSEDIHNFSISKDIINNYILNGLTFISEPFQDKNVKQTVFLYGITAPIFEKDKITGFVSVNFKINNKSLFPEILKKSDISFILLSKNKNIIAENINDFNIGKNILSLNGKENLIYNYALSGKKNSVSKITKIKFENAETKFLLISHIEKSKIFIKRNLFRLLFISLIILLITFVVFRYIFKNAQKPLKKIKKTSINLSKGVPDRIKIKDLNSDFSEIGGNLNKISERYNDIYEISEKITSGDFVSHLTPYSENDIPAVSINKIVDFLKKKEEEHIIKDEETTRQLWMRKGRFEISEAERISAKNTEELSYNLIRAVVKYTDALMGGIYYYDKENENIELIGAYAYDKDRHFHINFKPGEGVIGACVVEKKKVLMNKVPENYIKIATGLGSGSPSFIAVIPVFFKNEINAVIEIAFTEKPEDYKIEFIEQLSDNIGAWIDASIIRSKTQELLTISQEQTKKLAEKEEELNKKVAELQEIQEKTDEINKRYKSILNAVDQSIMTVEYTTDGTIIDCNKKYTEIMGFEPDEIKGKNVSELVKDQSGSWKKIIEEVKTGKIIKREVVRYTKDGIEKRLTATYTPYYNREGKITQVLFFAFDITNINIQ